MSRREPRLPRSAYCMTIYGWRGAAAAYEQLVLSVLVLVVEGGEDLNDLRAVCVPLKTDLVQELVEVAVVADDLHGVLLEGILSGVQGLDQIPTPSRVKSDTYTAPKAPSPSLRSMEKYL